MKQHIVILNRWDDEFSDYKRYINHDEYFVSYVTTKLGRNFIPECNVASLEEVSSTGNYCEVALAIHKIQQNVAAIDYLIALSEFDLLIAAELRAEFNIPGPKPKDVSLWRDKVLMKQAVCSAGIPTPRWLEHLEAPVLKKFCEDVKFPVILKPRKGAASQGVYKILSMDQLAQVTQTVDLLDYECEQFIDAQIGHADGVIADGLVKFFLASKYVNTCLDFSNGKFLGSYAITEQHEIDRIQEFTVAVLNSLNIQNSAFHLEFFMDDFGKLIFLEIGARVGGGEIPFMIRQVFGIDLFDLWLKAILKQDILPTENTSKACGFAMIPEPISTPVVVKQATSLKSKVPQIYHEILPSSGQILDGKGGYEKIAGRFRFVGQTSHEIYTAILKTAELFQLSFDPVISGEPQCN